MDSAIDSFLHQSRLVQRLSAIDDAHSPVFQTHFAEIFGQLFDLSGTVTLSKVLGDLPDVVSAPSGRGIEEITHAFIDGRKTLISFIAERFVPGRTQGRGKLPTPAEYHAHCIFTGVYTSKRSDFPGNQTAAYEPFRDFYVTAQRNMTGQIQHLRSRIGDAISGLSREFAQLVFLDRGFEQALSLQRRKIFDVIPELLGKRFQKLLHEHWHELSIQPAVCDLKRWMGPGGWLSVYYGEMQEMLLSELEIRLLPVLGWVDALSEAPHGGSQQDEPYERKNRNCG